MTCQANMRAAWQALRHETSQAFGSARPTRDLSGQRDSCDLKPQTAAISRPRPKHDPFPADPVSCHGPRETVALTLENVIPTLAHAKGSGALALAARCERYIEGEALTDNLSTLLQLVAAQPDGLQMQYHLMRAAWAQGLGPETLPALDGKLWESHLPSFAREDFTLARCAPTAGQAWTFDIDVAWFALDVLTLADQGSSSTFSVGPWQAHIKRIPSICSFSNTTDWIAYQLRLDLGDTVFEPQSTQWHGLRPIECNALGLRYRLDGGSIWAEIPSNPFAMEDDDASGNLESPSQDMFEEPSLLSWTGSIETAPDVSVWSPHKEEKGVLCSNTFIDDEQYMYSDFPITSGEAPEDMPLFSNTWIAREAGKQTKLGARIALQNCHLYGQALPSDRGILRADGHQYFRLKGRLALATQDADAITAIKSGLSPYGCNNDPIYYRR